MGHRRVALWGAIVLNLLCVGNSVQQQLPAIHIYNISDASATSHALTDTSHIQTLTAEQSNFNLAYEWLSKTQSWFGQYKKIVAGSGCIVAWALLYNRIVVINKSLEEFCWSAWKEHLSLERLSSASQDELAQELLLDIQQRYLNPANPIDSLSPLIEFVKVVEEEDKMIQDYLFLYKWTRRFFITRLFPFIESEVKHADGRLHRLAYVKELFYSWAVSQNFASLSKREKRALKLLMEEDDE